MEPIVEIFKKNENAINSNFKNRKSNDILLSIKNDLEQIGFEVEGGKGRLYRPVYFKEFGEPELQYHIDSYHQKDKIALEVEAGRSIRGNAIYRDIIQTSLLVGVDYFAVAVPQIYRFKSNKRDVEDRRNFEMCKSIFDAIYSTERLKLPFKGVILIGY